ncbi:unnamed protein product [Auanema sp. JU1783]|nr:unnamed protein product [Auanema sp. JU1783]
MGDKYNRSSSKSLNESFDVFEDDGQERAPSELEDSFDVFEASFSHIPLESTASTNDFHERLNRSFSSNVSRLTQSTNRPVSTTSRATPDDSFDETMVFTISSDSSDTELDTTFATENTSGTFSPPNCVTPTILTSTPIPPDASTTPRTPSALRPISRCSVVLTSTPIPPDDSSTPVRASATSSSTRRSQKILESVTRTSRVITSTQIPVRTPVKTMSVVQTENVDTPAGTPLKSTTQLTASAVQPEGEVFKAELANTSFSQAHDSSFDEIDASAYGTTNLDDLSLPGPSTSTSSDIPADMKVPIDLKKPHEDFRRKRDQIAAIMNSEDPDVGMGERYGSYMHLKKTKLQYQVNVLAKPKSTVSKLFEGISIFVNGHTDPSALELRELIQAHGGEYHCYLEYGTTTYTIASSLAAAKVNKARVNEIFLLPSWIVDSISAGTKLPIHKYILHSGSIEKASSSKAITNFLKRPDSSLSDTSTKSNYEEPILDARDPNFLQQFYSRSRLHLISTLAQEMKDYINVLREDNDFKCSRLDEIDLKSEDEGPSEPVFFHVDLDCFFVSVALRSRPDLIGKPVAITHSKGSANAPGMSEIASSSYPARALGLKNGMLVRDALKLCPSLICLPYSFDEYREVSKTIYTIVARYCKEIKAVSCDEMYINFSRTCRERHISDILKLAESIRADVRQDTGCSASVGIGPTVLIARLASRYAKPDGVRWVQQHEVVSFIAKEKISNLPGIGYAMMAKLVEVFGELELCRDLQGISETELTGLFGKKVGTQIYKLCRGEDSSEKDFLESTVRKSVSCDINYGIRFTKREEVDRFLGVLGAELEKKLDSCKMVTGSLTLKLMVRSAHAPVETAKYLGHGRCDTSSKSVLFKVPTKDQNFLTQEAIKLMNQMSPTVEDLRGIGLQCGRLKSEKGPSNTEMDMRSFFRVRRPPQQQPKNIEPLVSSKIRKSKFGGIVERDIPMANAKPVLFGESDSFQIRQVLKEMLLYEPTESVVFAIVDYLYELMASGYLDNLLSIAKFLNRMVYGNDCHEGCNLISLQAMNHNRRSETSSSSSTLYSTMAVKKIQVFKNGDVHHPGIRVVINRKQVHDLDVLFIALTERIDLPYGVKKLYTTGGKSIKSIEELEDGKDYIASSNIFIPIHYGSNSRIHSSVRKSRSLEPEARKKLKKKRASSTKRLSHPPEKEVAVRPAAVDENSIKKKTTKKLVVKEKKIAEIDSKNNKKNKNDEKAKKAPRKPEQKVESKKKDLDILVLPTKSSSTTRSSSVKKKEVNKPKTADSQRKKRESEEQVIEKVEKKEPKQKEEEESEAEKVTEVEKKDDHSNDEDEEVDDEEEEEEEEEAEAEDENDEEEDEDHDDEDDEKENEKSKRNAKEDGGNE